MVPETNLAPPPGASQRWRDAGYAAPPPLFLHSS